MIAFKISITAFFFIFFFYGCYHLSAFFQPHYRELPFHWWEPGPRLWGQFCAIAFLISGLTAIVGFMVGALQLLWG